MKKIAVIDVQSQLEALIQQEKSLDGVELYCLNPELWPFLDSRKIAYKKIQDEFIQEDWKKIHVWTRETALTWFDHPELKQRLMVRGVNLGNIILNDFRHVLLQIVTNLCVIRKILKYGAGSQVIVFQETPQSKRSFFDRSESRDTVNYILDALAKQAGSPIQYISYGISKSDRFDFQNALRGCIGNFYSLYSCLTSKIENSIAVFGAMNHLQGFAAEFQRRGSQFYILDSVFRPALFKKAKEFKVPYIVKSRLLFPRALANEWKKLKQNLEKIPLSILESGIFRFENVDVSSFVAKHLEDGDDEIKIKLEDILFSEYLIKSKKTSALLLDEDTSFRRTYAATFDAMNKPAFVVSHGVPGGDYQIDSNIKTSSYGRYFVNSEFEKEKYCSMGWDPERVLTTGVSRYDRIHLLKNEVKTVRSRKVVLYCPHRLTEKRTRAFGINTPGYVTYQNTIHVIEAVKDLDCELWIKPHADAGDIKIWNSFAEKDTTGKIKTVPASANIFELLSKSDLLVSTFSSVIIEGLLFDIPVITINFTGRPDIHPYAATGVTLGVYQPSELKQAISNCLNDEKTKQALKASREKNFSYFCGYSDGNNTKRSVDKIAESIAGKQHLETVTR